jgi:hypothetical protein
MSSEAKWAGMGGSLEEARTSDFFRWFHLADVGEPAVIDNGAQQAVRGTWHRFRPSGPSFHQLVELAVGVGADKQIHTAWLGLDRAFIADSRIRPFARDIAKSFLNWILPADACNALASQIDAISQFCDGESVVIRHVSAMPALGPERPRVAGGDLADVFIGNAAHAQQTIGRTRIVFENRIESFAQGVSSNRDALCSVPDKAQDAWLRLAAWSLPGANDATAG